MTNSQTLMTKEFQMRNVKITSRGTAADSSSGLANSLVIMISSLVIFLK